VNLAGSYRSPLVGPVNMVVRLGKHESLSAGCVAGSGSESPSPPTKEVATPAFVIHGTTKDYQSPLRLVYNSSHSANFWFPLNTA
jgi:hypothetical protein